MRNRLSLAVLFLFSVGFPARAEVTSLDLNGNQIPDKDEAEVIVDHDATLAAGEYYFNNLKITNNATLFANGDGNSSSSFKGVKIHAASLAVSEGALISVGGGHASCSGPGSSCSPGIGASYGGKGYGASDSSVYGSAAKPLDLGSGGSYSGGLGGGALWLDVDALANDGWISADGGFSASGGSIYVVAKSLSGNGDFSAKGGDYYYAANYVPGGGGRIALYYASSTFTGTANAFGGCWQGTPRTCVESGTVGFFDTATNDFTAGPSWKFQSNDGPESFNQVKISNLSNAKIDGDLTISASKLIVDGGSSLVISGAPTLNIGEIRVDSGSALELSGDEKLTSGSLTVSGNSTITVAPQKKLLLEIPSISIASGSYISANGKGYLRGSGPGFMDGVGFSYSGASYGGIGEGNNAQSVYGSEREPADLGSGSSAGNGGGAVRIVADSLNNDGVISADGSASASGGSVYVTVKTLSGTGTFRARGGDWTYGSVYYLPGGGGRIAVYYDTSAFSGDASAKGGCYPGTQGACTGGDGTVVMEQTASAKCAENCYSNVLFIPGIKGSVLKIGSDTVWPPTIVSNDIPQLALDGNGKSIHEVKVDGILKSFYGTPIYASFSDFLDGLVNSGAINKWQPLAYDWRYMPEEILEGGISTTDGDIDVIDEVEKLASNSKSGKVVIVAHSMGGLLGKAIIKKLEEKGEENLIDSFVMVASPQLGTPQAAAALLHGHDEGILFGLIASSKDMRSVAQNMGSAFNLLPSRKYFEAVSDPLIVLDKDSSFAKPWIDALGTSTISTYVAFDSFVSGLNPSRSSPLATDLVNPEVLKTNFLDAADKFHDTYDGYQIPQSIRVVQIAGWGLPTVKDIKYTTDHGKLGYRADFTIEGDGVVVYPSAVSSNASETYYLNAFDYNKDFGVDIKHRDITAVPSIQSVVESISESKAISEDPYLVKVKPSPKTRADELVVSSHSPVIVGAYDVAGNYTGVNRVVDSNGILKTREEIPGSAFVYFGDSQYIFLPKEGVYNFIVESTGTGLATLEVERFSDNSSSLITSYTDMTVATSTTARFILDSQNPAITTVNLDSNGDGKEDVLILPDHISFEDLLLILRNKVSELNISQSIKRKLYKLVDQLENRIIREVSKKNSEKNKKGADLFKQLKNLVRKISGVTDDSEIEDITAIIRQIGNLF